MFFGLQVVARPCALMQAFYVLCCGCLQVVARPCALMLIYKWVLFFCRATKEPKTRPLNRRGGLIKRTLRTDSICSLCITVVELSLHRLPISQHCKSLANVHIQTVHASCGIGVVMELLLIAVFCVCVGLQVLCSGCLLVFSRPCALVLTLQVLCRLWCIGFLSTMRPRANL